MAKTNKIVKSVPAEVVTLTETFSEDDIRHRIYTIRGVQVMLDRDLAFLYQVQTGHLNEAVKRNKERFPEDFMFQLTKDEWTALKSQFAISNIDDESLKSQFAMSNGRGGIRRLPYAFTEEGVSQLASVLRSKVAIQTSIRIQRVFVAMRKFLMQNAGVFQRLEQHQTTAMRNTFEVYHKQYPKEHVELHTFNKSHDRWLIIDDEVYHFGASIKDLGLKWFSVNQVTEYTAEELINRIN